MAMTGIVQSPHSKKPEQMFKILERQYNSLEATVGEQKLDKDGIKRLKEKLKGGKIKIK